jgi:hypothetical protein
MTYRTVGKALGRVEGPAQVSGHWTSNKMPKPRPHIGRGLAMAHRHNALQTRQHTPPLAPQTP